MLATYTAKTLSKFIERIRQTPLLVGHKGQNKGRNTSPDPNSVQERKPPESTSESGCAAGQGLGARAAGTGALLITQVGEWSGVRVNG